MNNIYFWVGFRSRLQGGIRQIRAKNYNTLLNRNNLDTFNWSNKTFIYNYTILGAECDPT